MNDPADYLLRKPGQPPADSEHPIFRRPGRALGQSSHLDRHSRGSLRFKITLPGNGPFVGKRVTIPLGTHDPDEAEARAQIVRITLDKTGIIPFSEEIEAGDNSETGTCPQFP